MNALLAVDLDSLTVNGLLGLGWKVISALATLCAMVGMLHALKMCAVGKGGNRWSFGQAAIYSGTIACIWLIAFGIGPFVLSRFVGRQIDECAATASCTQAVPAEAKNLPK